MGLSRLHIGPFTDGQYTTSFDDIIVSASPIAGAPMPGGEKVLAKPAIPAPQQQATFCTNKGYKAGCTITSYYYFNGQRVAMRVQSDANATGVVTWLHGDHLGSASVATDAGGNKIAGDTVVRSANQARALEKVSSRYLTRASFSNRLAFPRKCRPVYLWTRCL